MLVFVGGTIQGIRYFFLFLNEQMVGGELSEF